MDEIIKLKAEAARARRFASNTFDEPTRAAMEQAARDCEARIEAILSGDDDHSDHITA